MRVLNEYWNSGGNLHWIAQTASEHPDAQANIHMMAANDPIAMYDHDSPTDHLFRQRRMDEVSPDSIPNIDPFSRSRSLWCGRHS